MGVISHHVAVSGPIFLERVQTTVAGHPMPFPPTWEQFVEDVRIRNREHARQNADVCRGEALDLLRDAGARVGRWIRRLDDADLDKTIETKLGRLG